MLINRNIKIYTASKIQAIQHIYDCMLFDISHCKRDTSFTPMSIGEKKDTFCPIKIND